MVAAGRKNWMFAGSDKGGRRAAIFYSLIDSAKANGGEPFVYLKSLFELLPTWPKGAYTSFGRYTDTTACIASGLAGLRHGIGAILRRWRDGLREFRLFLLLLDKLLRWNYWFRCCWGQRRG